MSDFDGWGRRSQQRIFFHGEPPEPKRCWAEMPDGTVCIRRDRVFGMCVRAARHADPDTSLWARAVAWLLVGSEPEPGKPTRQGITIGRSTRSNA